MPLPGSTQAPSVFRNEHGIDTFLVEANEARLENEKISLRSHQLECCKKIINWFCDQNSPKTALVILPTGTGKSGIAVLAPYITKSSRVLMLTPSLTISKQLERDFTGDGDDYKQAFLYRTNFIQDGYPASILPSVCCVENALQIKNAVNTNTSLLIVNAHKIGDDKKRKVQIDDIPVSSFDLVIVDEAHHYPAETWKRIVDHFPGSKKLFLTATPFNRQGELIVPNSSICFDLSRAKAVSDGYIRELVFKEISPKANQDMYDGPSYAARRASAIAEAVVSKLHEHDAADNRHIHKAMVLCQSKDSLHSVNEMLTAFKDFPYVAAYTGDQSDIERKAIMSKYREGSIRVLLICGMLIEGFDHKEISVVAIYRNVAKESRVLFSQFVGRAVRRIDQTDKIQATIITHEFFKQRYNFDQIDALPVDEGDDRDELDGE